MKANSSGVISVKHLLRRTKVYIKTDERFDIKYIDQSGLTEFTRCPAKFMFSRLMGLRLPEEVSIAPDFGTCIHRALPYAYDGANNLDRAMEEFRAEWTRLGYSDGDDKRNEVRARAMLENFAEQRTVNYRPYNIVNVPISAPTKDIISPNEIPFLLDIGGNLPIAGRIDLMVEWKQSKQLWVDDYKTSSEISARLFDCFKAAPQPCLYTLAGTQITGERVVGMIIEALRVSPKNAETQINHIFVSDYELSSMRDFTNRKSDEMLECNKTGCWMKNLSMCSPYGSYGIPGRSCRYKRLCTGSPDWRDTSKMYRRDEPFHPFKINV